MNKEDIHKQLVQVQIQSVVLLHRNEAALKQFQAAVLASDGQLCQKLREQIHGLMDETLDNNASMMSLTRLLILAAD